MISNKGWIVIGLSVVLGILTLLAYYFLYKPQIKKINNQYQKHKWLNILSASILMVIMGIATGIIVKVAFFVIQSLSIFP